MDSKTNPFCLAQFIQSINLDTPPSHMQVDAIEAAGVKTRSGNGSVASFCLNRFDSGLECGFNFEERLRLCGGCALGVEVELPQFPTIAENQIRNCDG